MQRDPYMGRTIRLAGADYLDRQHFVEILEELKRKRRRRSSPCRQRPYDDPFTGGRPPQHDYP